MKIGLLSDIHSNLEALEVALSILESENIEEMLCIGDIVGYGAEPDKCVEIMKAKTDHIVAGNHDWATIGKTDTQYFNIYGRSAILWTGQALGPSQKAFLAELPLYYTGEDICMVHASPAEPSEWDYVFSPSQALKQFHHFNEKICFIGHSHKPLVFSDQGEKIFIQETKDNPQLAIDISPDKRYIVNIGSVGQPRDGDPRGCVVVFDTEKDQIKFIRFEYPVKIAQRKIIDAGLPIFLAERLALGT